jgi:hypothetical protein
MSRNTSNHYCSRVGRLAGADISLAVSCGCRKRGRPAISGGIRRLLVFVVAALTLFFGNPLGTVPEANAAATAYASCGTTLVSGGKWLDGQGVPVHSNGNDTGTGYSCGGNGTYGSDWQCVELAQRLYGLRHWYDSNLFPVSEASQIYGFAATTPRYFKVTANRSIRADALVPGDLIVFGGSPGHVAVINTVTPNSDGTYQVGFMQQNVGKSNASGVLVNAPTGSIKLTAGSLASYLGMSAKGVVHALNNHLPPALGATHSVVAALGLGSPASGGYQPYENTDAAGAFAALGGWGTSAPAVVGYAGAPYYIMAGPNDGNGNNLWIRSQSSSWSPLGAAGTQCLDVGAVVQGSTLTVACRGADNAVWAGSTTIPAPGQLPSVIGFHSLGGTVPNGSGVAVGLVNDQVTYFATGIEMSLNGQSGNVYTTTSSFATSATWHPWVCQGHPAVGSAGSVTYVACHGSDDAVWYATSNSGGAWSGMQSLGGVVYGDTPVGIAVLGNGTASVYAEGVDTSQSVWQNIGITSTYKGNGWSQLPDSSVIGGVGAGSY